MVNREYKDTATEQEKRAIASLEVFVVFNSPDQFVVTEKDPKICAAFGEPNKEKYFGKVSKNKENDECSCPSFVYGMAYEKMEDGTKGESRYVAEHGTAFQCKHLIRARSIRFGEKIE